MDIIIIISFFVGLYSKLKVISIDIYRAFAWIIPFIRKNSCKYEIENSINTFSTDIHTNFFANILPECKVTWVNATNLKSIRESGKVIIRINFDEDHNVNYFNATTIYIRDSLLDKTKPFIKDCTKKAIDLVSTKIFLRDKRIQALTLFNESFINEKPEVKDIYVKLDESHEKGLFTRVLLSELHLLGEILVGKTPLASIENEIEDFVNWFYQLASRVTDERTVLRFERTYIKIGVILVANEETYNKFGNEAYVRRALTYVGSKFDCIFIIARGRTRTKIAENIISELETEYGFDVLTKNIPYLLVGDKGKQYHNTCVALKPNSTTLLQKAWEKVNTKYQEGEQVSATIDYIGDDDIRVDVFGLKVFIPKNQLSGCEIHDISNYFDNDQELKLKIINFIDGLKIELSNIGTDTDPRRLIDSFLKSPQQIEGIITKIKDSGILINIPGSKLNGFILRKDLTHSRYLNLKDKFIINTNIKIDIKQYNPSYDNFICTPIEKINDPWEEDFGFIENNMYDCYIREIRERYIICELKEGIDGKISDTEVCWEQPHCNFNTFKVGQKIRVLLMKIDKTYRMTLLSIKRVSENPTRLYYESNKDHIINAKVGKIKPSGIEIVFDNPNTTGFVHISEIQWGYCSTIPIEYKEGEPIDVCLLNYDDSYNTIRCSHKKVYKNDYDNIKLVYSQNQIVSGNIDLISNGIAYFKINVNGYEGFGYINKSKISNSFYIHDEDLGFIFDKSKNYHFQIIRPDDRNQIFELSRKEVLLKNTSLIEFGMDYNGRIFGHDKKIMKFYNDTLEGYIMKDKEVFLPGSDVNVSISSKFDRIELFINN